MFHVHIQTLLQPALQILPKEVPADDPRVPDQAFWNKDLEIEKNVSVIRPGRLRDLPSFNAF